MTCVQCFEAEGILLSILLRPHLEVVWDTCEHVVSAVLVTLTLCESATVDNESLGHTLKFAIKCKTLGCFFPSKKSVGYGMAVPACLLSCLKCALSTSVSEVYCTSQQLVLHSFN